ncbi:MAG TPA: plastocyanin/azurin family copper-binding protein [Solirubrobacterales bacterium]|nr:plastocyanin/azurin family copper-binding protein [Solirubrobacterales bacterium]
MKKLVAFLVLALAALALVACGGSDDDGSGTTATSGGATENSSEASGGVKEETSQGGGGGSASTLKFEADPNGDLAYTTTSASAKAGKVTIDFNNPQALTHDVAIEDASGKEVGATELIADASDSTTVELKPGSYTFFCSVPGHREAGMEGTLTVK